MWSSRNLSKIVSYIGTPLATDRMTGDRTKLDYARVLFDVKSTVNLPDEIHVRGPNGTRVMQKVIYEWKMKKCSGCGFLGHGIENCRRRKPKHAQKNVNDKVASNDVSVSLPAKEVSSSSPPKAVDTIVAPIVVTKQVHDPAPKGVDKATAPTASKSAGQSSKETEKTPAQSTLMIQNKKKDSGAVHGNFANVSAPGS